LNKERDHYTNQYEGGHDAEYYIGRQASLAHPKLRSVWVAAAGRRQVARAGGTLEAQATVVKLLNQLPAKGCFLRCRLVEFLRRFELACSRPQDLELPSIQVFSLIGSLFFLLMLLLLN